VPVEREREGAALARVVIVQKVALDQLRLADRTVAEQDYL
jgi:hypothetical protein